MGALYEDELQRLSIDTLESHGWIYKKAEELSEETMINVKPKAMRDYLKQLVKAGWLEERRNPKVKMDRTLQYRVNILNIQLDLLALGYNLDGYPLPVVKREKEYTYFPEENSNVQKDVSTGEKENRKVEKEKAIPEITNIDLFKEMKEEKEEHSQPTETHFQNENHPYEFYRENFGDLTSYVRTLINHWLSASVFTEPEKVMTLAMKTALKNNVLHYSYVNKILEDWQQKGVKTEAQALAVMQTYKQKQKKTTFVNRKTPSVSHGPIPKWLYDENYGKEPYDPEELERLKAEVAEKKRQLKAQRRNLGL
ncbi:DnaD and phage-associated domain-containing protein [Evansella caseinilytica]|uniref:DnaD and phage-associated domain-containing protein n=1 Tax=Evansella caseinilytica TaxID=1503961 RepID=A0A1H3V261_9BACI|nr:DnaD domain protein [Evansella caseinilytica]SDZ68782.1 DnaD and phage-associated domain-containing protein [Evansella caseinilytica]